MFSLSKSTYIKGDQCIKALYLEKNRSFLRDKISARQLAVFSRGTNVGILARDCYPGGLDMSPKSPKMFGKMITETIRNINNPNVNVLYEAVFKNDDTLIMLDIIVRDGDKWKAIEVKSSTALSTTYYKDAALQYYVLNGCGIQLSDFQLMYINSEYTRHDDIDLTQLFKCQSVLNDIKTYQEEIRNNIQKFKTALGTSHSPAIPIGVQCHKPYICDFRGHCWKNVPKDSYLFMTAMNEEILFEEYNNGICTNEDFIRHNSLDNIQLKQIEALNNNTYYINKVSFLKMSCNTTGKIAYLSMMDYNKTIPENEGEHPYQPTFDAFCILYEEDEKTVYHFWEKTEENNKEAYKILADSIKDFDKVVLFTHNADVFHQISNENLPEIIDLHAVLIKADFFHKKIRMHFTLKNVYEGIKPGNSINEHESMILNNNDKPFIKECLRKEAEAIKEIFNEWQE